MHKPTILLIDDKTDIAHTFMQYLPGLLYEPEQVVICHDSSELTSHNEVEWSVIMMPLSSSEVETNRLLKQLQQQFHYTPVIIIARKNKEEKAVKAVACGADDYLISEEVTEAVLQKTIRCAVARSRIHYRQLFVESPAPMYIYDKNSFRFLAVNKACCKQYGYSEDEFLQMTAEQIRPVEDVSSFRSVSEAAPRVYHDFGQWKHLTKKGEEFIVNVYAHDTKFGNKQARLVTAINVSNVVLARQELQDKNKEVGNILESITDGFFALNLNGEFTYVNKECEKIFGFKRAELMGKHITEVYSREEYASFYQQYQQAENKRVNMRFESFINSIGKWLSITLYPTKNGMAVYVVNITERRLIREKLYNDGQQLRAIINNTPDIIWLLNAEGNITVRNDAFRQWMQHLVEETDTHTLPPAIASNWKEHFDTAFGGQATTFTAMETKGSELFYREVSLYPVHSAGGEVVSISCFARDVTQQQVRIQKIQLQNEYLEKIAWMHSHEARGPVANILGLASLFNMNDAADPDNTMMMELIIESSQQLDKVIRKIVADIDAYQLNYGDEE